ncbi:STM4504/CBY_0614 family protein, partial [Aquidulcibacter sp.]|uniref:STM4504/CBY_0614 family protein n=1 Tax=Aquidulcibacter sp. TaxID=2052990 RepID=UPI0025C20CBB
EPKAAIEALNYRFKEHGVGYQYEGGKIIRVDATFIHSELVKPVISLLANRKFSGAQDEFLRAHECYRHGDHKTCVNECLKAFESTLKTICKEMKWLVDPDAPAKKLIEACLTNELIPSYLQDQYTQLRQLLTSGVPTLRNKESGHGQGSEIKEVPNYLASYALNLTATSIMFLVKAYEAKA